MEMIQEYGSNYITKTIMKEIKFRAWDKEKKEIWNVESIHIQDEYCNLFKKSIYGKNTAIKNSRLEIMQFIGLKDKNGKEIYDGDIVEWKQAEGGILESNIDTKVHICKIDWFMNGWACRLNDEHCGFTLGSSHITIIGNIYENPEIISNI